mgnify:CR=1 FL=1|tara:strand:- start:586 stop:990 length:405 start_codon:yes stop_codon:yes gene_type:complete
MSLLEYAKNKNMDVVTMDNLVKKFKDKNDDAELNELLQFMAEKINFLMKQSSKESIKTQDTTKQTKNKEIVKEANEFIVKSFKITTDKLYLIMGKNEALEYKFEKDNISKCFEIITSQRISKSDIGTIFKKVSI